MINSVSVQCLEFLYSAAFGVSLGFLYDVVRTFRSFVKNGKLGVGLFDTLYWILAIVLLFAFVLTYLSGKMRWYVLPGAFCGGFVYMSVLSETMFSILKTAVYIIRRMLHGISIPIFFLFRSVWRGMKKIGRWLFVRKKKGESGNGKKKKKEKHGDNPEALACGICDLHGGDARFNPG